MACSAAQRESNIRNAAHSTGPKTLAGKARSRRNALKHGMTGAGIAIQAEDAAEVEKLCEELEAELKPKNRLAFEALKRIALFNLRLDRSAEHEARTIDFNMRQAIIDFDDAQFYAIENSYAWIAAEPETHARRLRRTPLGINRLIWAFEGLLVDLDHAEGPRWTFHHCEHLHHMMGLRRVDLPVNRAKALTEAIRGDFQFLNLADASDLDKKARQAWAVARLIEFIHGEIAKLRELLAKLDLSDLERNRAEAPYRAMFDASPAAILARKYEAANERGLYRALHQFHEANAEPESGAEPEVKPELGLSLPEPSGSEDIPAIVDPIEPEVEVSTDPATKIEPEVDPMTSGGEISTFLEGPGVVEGQAGWERGGRGDTNR